MQTCHVTILSHSRIHFSFFLRHRQGDQRHEDRHQRAGPSGGLRVHEAVRHLREGGTRSALFVVMLHVYLLAYC